MKLRPTPEGTALEVETWVDATSPSTTERYTDIRAGLASCGWNAAAIALLERSGLVSHVDGALVFTG